MNKADANPANQLPEAEALARESADWLPRAGDRLFVASEHGASLDPMGFTAAGEPRVLTGRWYLYADGFLSAADRLAEGCRGLPYEDALIYPILTLYRHHLELEIKYVLRCCPGCTEGLKNWLTERHGLRVLWDKIAKIYPGFCEWADPKCTEACRQLILEFDEHDPNSQGARYPVDREGKPTLQRLEVVDRSQLRKGVHKVSHYLGAIIEQIGQDQEWEAEMASW